MKIKTKILLKMLKNISGGIKSYKKQELSFYVLIKIIKEKIFCIAINNQTEIVTYENIEEGTGETEVIVKYNLIEPESVPFVRGTDACRW